MFFVLKEVVGDMELDGGEKNVVAEDPIEEIPNHEITTHQDEYLTGGIAGSGADIETDKVFKHPLVQACVSNENEW